jgi:hypothetical protein
MISIIFDFAVFGKYENMTKTIWQFFYCCHFPYLLGYPIFIRIGYPVLALSMVDLMVGLLCYGLIVLHSYSLVISYEPYDMN